jgi:hypothetical protein
MTPADRYRAKAAEYAAQARSETITPTFRVACKRLTKSYLDLAELAERNSLTNIVYETPTVSAEGESVDFENVRFTRQ